MTDQTPQPCPFTHLVCDEIPEDLEDGSQEAGWRIHDFGEGKTFAHWLCGGLEEAEAKFIVEACNAYPTHLAEIAALRAERDALREALPFVKFFAQLKWKNSEPVIKPLAMECLQDKAIAILALTTGGQ